MSRLGEVIIVVVVESRKTWNSSMFLWKDFISFFTQDFIIKEEFMSSFLKIRIDGGITYE